MPASGPGPAAAAAGPGFAPIGTAPMRLTLLSRSYCHLCDEMLAALAPLVGDVPVDVLDVDAPEHAALEAAFGAAVPVLFAGPPAAGRELCRYHLDAARVGAALADAAR